MFLKRHRELSSLQCSGESAFLSLHSTEPQPGAWLAPRCRRARPALCRVSYPRLCPRHLPAAPATESRLRQSPDASLPGGMGVGDGLHSHFSFSVHSSHCLVVAERKRKTLPARSWERSLQPHGLPTAVHGRPSDTLLPPLLECAKTTTVL